jgi:dolichyl-phosphate beta-glucosyltransferase
MKTKISPDVEKTVIRYEKNHGKGYAVKTGMKITRGKYAMFADSGLCTDYRFTLDGLRLLSSGVCDLAYASRRLRQSVIKKPQHWTRRMTSQLFRGFVMWFMNVPRHLSDTQCGFKLYRGEVGRELYAECLTEGFTFDVEIILRAQKKGYRIAEFPIEWRSDHDTRVRPLKMFRRIFPELMTIRKELSRIN